MKICKAIQDRKRKQKLIQLRNLLVCEIECINTKLELLQLLLAGLNANAVTEISEEMESLLMECQLYSVQKHREKLQHDHFFRVEFDCEIKNALSQFDMRSKILSAIDKLKKKEAKPQNFIVLRENVLLYIQNLQKVLNGCISQIFTIDQNTSDDAYVGYLECLNFRVDLVDEEPEVDLAVPEEESHLEHLANLTFGDDPITSNEILEF